MYASNLWQEKLWEDTRKTLGKREETMNSGKWQINKVGLVDFWYYDEEAFDF